MNRPYMNDDILLQVMSFADKQTVLNLLQTSKMLHHHGARYLLRGNVEIDTSFDRQVVSFTSFMLCDQSNLSSRLPFLKTLKLFHRDARCHPDYRPESSTATIAGASLQLLFSMLAREGNLLKLSMWQAEAILAMHSKLPEAVAELQTLTHLSVQSVGKHTSCMLKALRSRLVRADIIMRGGRGDSEDSPSGIERDPTRLLYHSMTSLQELHSVNTELHASSLCFPNVTFLEFEPHRMQFCQTQHYVRVFPNLRHLSIDDCADYWPGAGDSIEHLLIKRASNLSAQQRLGSWPSLERCGGTIGPLYLLGIPCRIRSLDICDAIWGWIGCACDPEVLDTVLGCARPCVLRLTLWHGFWFESPHFLETFSRSENVGALEFLAFDLELMRVEPDPASDRFPAALDTVIPAAVCLLDSLTAFVLRIDCHDLQQRPQGGLCPLEEALNVWDMAAFARRVHAAGAPALLSVSVHMTGHTVRGDESVQIGPVSQLEP
ncbi:hypothetical protein BD413DRAFT_482473 [Trametes elegans]|nr:hypothetical protein BD413DRAFT_482473 [Trametes elegans]